MKVKVQCIKIGNYSSAGGKLCSIKWLLRKERISQSNKVLIAINQKIKRQHKCKAGMRKEMIKISEISKIEDRNNRKTQQR